MTVPAVAAEPRSVTAQSEGRSKSENARERALFRLGLNAYKAGRIEEARQLLGEAWELRPSYDIAASLGQVEFELGRVVRANELLDYCLQNFPPIESDEKLLMMRQVREKVRSRVSELAPHCDCNGAELLVDDIVVGTLPLTKPLYVQPGRHFLALRRDGVGVDLRVLVEAQAGQRHALDLTAKQAERPPPPKVNRATPAVEVPEDGSPSWPFYVGGGLVALNVAAAIGFRVAADDAAERATALRHKLSSDCDSGTASQNELICGQISDADSDEKQYARLSVYTGGAAATVALATAAYWVWSIPAKRRPQRTGMTAKTTHLSWSLSGDSKSAYLIAIGRF